MEEIEIDFKKIFNLLKKKWILIAIITLSLTLITGLVSFFVIPPKYKADISVLIESTAEQSDKTQNYNDIMMYQKLVKTYSEFSKKRIVIEDVINELNLDKSIEEVQSMVSASGLTDTNFLTISVTSSTPKEAKDIANQLAKSLIRMTRKVSGVDNVKRVDDALLPTSPSSPRKILNMGIAFLLGIMISVGTIFLMEYIDNTVKSSEELEKLLDIPVLGEISLVIEK